MRRPIPLFACLLLVLGSIAVTYALAAPADPLDRPMVITGRDWIDLVCAFGTGFSIQTGQNTYVYDENSNRLIVHYLDPDNDGGPTSQKRGERQRAAAAARANGLLPVIAKVAPNVRVEVIRD